MQQHEDGHQLLTTHWAASSCSSRQLPVNTAGTGCWQLLTSRGLQHGMECATLSRRRLPVKGVAQLGLLAARLSCATVLPSRRTLAEQEGIPAISPHKAA